MSAETPNPQPGDRVRVTYEGIYEVTPNGALLASDGSPKRSIFDDATVEVLERALCAEIEGATGIRCQQPTGHVGGHKGTTTEEQTKAVGYPLFVSWPAEAEQPARRSVRVPNEPHGLPNDMQRRIGELLARGDFDGAEAIAGRYMEWAAVDGYLQDRAEYQTYLAAHGEKREPRMFWPGADGVIVPEPDDNIDAVDDKHGNRLHRMVGGWTGDGGEGYPRQVKDWDNHVLAKYAPYTEVV